MRQKLKNGEICFRGTLDWSQSKLYFEGLSLHRETPYRSLQASHPARPRRGLRSVCHTSPRKLSEPWSPPTVDITELKQKSVAELHAMAEELNITNYSGLRKQDLIFRIEQSLLDSDTVLRGEGVLEILPEGYGFLRSQDWNYL